MKCWEEDYVEGSNAHSSIVRCETTEKFCRYTIDNRIREVSESYQESLNRSCAERDILTIFEVRRINLSCDTSVLGGAACPVLEM